MSVSTYAFMTEPVSGVHEAVLRREGKNKIIVSTNHPLSDDQMKDLYWVILAMEKTGVRLKDLFRSKNNFETGGENDSD